MKEALLILCMLIVFVYGYFLINRLGKFLGENKNAISKKEEVKEPALVMLKSDLSDDEINDEIHKFKNRHPETKIYLCDSDEINLPEDTDEDQFKNE